jgi:apolipoprotein N-acyltransferase
MFRPMKNIAATTDKGSMLTGRISSSTLIAAVAGLMATTAMPPFHHTGVLIIPALALLFLAVLQSERPARTAWAFGLVHQLTLLHWLFMLGDAAPIASRTLVPLSAAGAIVYVSLYVLAWGRLVGLVRDHLGHGFALVMIPLLWTGMEWVRGVGDLAFPWCLSGAAVLTTPWTLLAAAGGELGLGACIALIATALVAWAWRAQWNRVLAWTLTCAVLLMVVMVALGVSSRRVTDGPVFRVASIQADVALADKWDSAKRDSTLVPYTKLSRNAAADGADLLIWAETSIPAYLRYDRNLSGWVKGMADSLNVHMFVGHPEALPGVEGQHLRYNGSSLFDTAGVRVDGYRKHHLLPFGEVMPFQKLFPFLGQLDLGQAEWDLGQAPSPMPVVVAGDTLSFAALICYESCFAGLSHNAVLAGANALVNITNDGWFGHTAGPVQHGEMARLRAAECGVPLIRCANNGVSFITDDLGNKTVELGLGQRGVVMDDVVLSGGSTAFVRYGSRPVWIGLMAWTVIGLIIARRKQR